MEIKSTKTCDKCRYFERFYFKGVTRFTPSKSGRCKAKSGLTTTKESCENWANRLTLRQRRIRRASRALNDIFLEIAAIRQILEEEKDAQIYEEKTDL